jgi:hypothetical protein
MAPERRRQLILAALVVALGVVIYWVWPRQAAPVPGASNTRAARQARSGEPAAAPDVHLEALESERPKPEEGERNLFRFKSLAASPKPPSPTPPAPVQPAPQGPVAPSAPTVAPIPLRFIGVETLPGGKKQAILRDDRGVYFGGEGAEIDGRYRILRIGDESIDMAYLDGRGRQTLRLSGS